MVRLQYSAILAWGCDNYIWSANMTKYEAILNNSDEFTDVKLTPTEGIASIALITMLADRPDAEIPVDRLLDILSTFELFDESSEEELLASIDKLAEIADKEGLGALFNAADDVDVISDDLVPTAYAIAIAASVSMGATIGKSDLPLTIPPIRKAFLQELQIALDVDAEESATITADVLATLQEEPPVGEASADNE
jgi:hypothetical protein